MRGKTFAKNPGNEPPADWEEARTPSQKVNGALGSSGARQRVLPWALAAGTFLEFLFLSVFRLPNQFEVSVVNPLGFLTAYLVFDDWWNILILAFAVCTVVLSIAQMTEGHRALTPVAFLAATNFSGVIASLIWLVSPFARAYYDPSKGAMILPVAVGMSASVFGAVSFAFLFGVFAQLSLYKRLGAEAYLAGQLPWVLLYFSGVSCVFLGSAFLYQPATQLSHAAGIASGFLIALAAAKSLGRRGGHSRLPLVLTRDASVR